MNRRSRILTYLCLLVAVGCCSLWALSRFISPKTVYVSSGLHRFLSVVGHPERVQEFVGRKAASYSEFEEWKLTFAFDSDSVPTAISANELETYYTVELYRGAFVTNALERTRATVVGASVEVSVGITKSFEIPLWSFAVLALVYPAYQLLRLNKRKRRSGLCENCGYDLRGSVSGACSECGTEIIEVA